MSVNTMMFSSKKNPRYLNYMVTEDTIDQAVQDWLRDGQKEGLLNINGLDLTEAFKKHKEIIPSQEVTPESLLKLWELEIINKLGLEPQSDKANEMINFMTKYFHQGAFLHIMHSALWAAATQNNHTISGSDVVSHINIFVENQSLIIQEDTKVYKILNVTNPEIEIKFDGESPPPVVVGSITHQISFNQDNKLSHQITNSDVHYLHDDAKKVIDARSVLRKIYEAFLELFAIKIKINNLRM